MAKSSFGFFLYGDLVYSLNLSHGKEKYFYKKIKSLGDALPCLLLVEMLVSIFSYKFESSLVCCSMRTNDRNVGYIIQEKLCLHYIEKVLHA
jgi:hypothetical protein